MSKSKISEKGNGQSSIARIFALLNNQVVYLILVIILIGIIATAINPNFFTLRNLLNIMQQVATLGILTMVLSLLMISGGLDISHGNLAGLLAIIFARFILAGNSIALGVIIVLAIGTFFGFVNGFIIAKSKVTPLIITLGMSYVFLGMALIIGGGRPKAITGQFEFLGQQRIGGIVPVSILFFLGIFAFSYLLRKYTKYGRRLNAIGGNPMAAYLSGINVNIHVISIYTLGGLIVGFTALVLISRLSMIQADVGSSYSLQALAAAIIGGITFEGGRGSLVGAFFGVLLLGILNNALNIIGISSFVQTIVLGAIIVIATVVSNIGSIRQ
ncbi:MAG: ABC transporter permease [Actinomycetia bacterium]|nr:ABC transporter permease [Actinomycetes bacterium]